MQLCESVVLSQLSTQLCCPRAGGHVANVLPKVLVTGTTKAGEAQMLSLVLWPCLHTYVYV